MPSASGTHRLIHTAKRRHGVGMAARFERDPIAWPKLPGERKISRDDDSDLGIATAGLAVGHQEDRVPRWWKLDATDKGRLRKHVAA
jgi:hypothetical protein